MTATKMKEALDTIAKESDGRPGHVAARALDGVADSTIARMDWAAGLTDDQMRVLRLAVELITMTEIVHKHDQDRQAFYWLRHGLEALP